MGWNRGQIHSAAIGSAAADYAAFEAIGLSEMQNLRILDIGCFDGFNTRLKFMPYGNIIEVVGIDPETSHIELARASTADSRFSWQVGTAESMAERNMHPFDVVYLSHTLQHVPDKHSTLEACMKLLRPGGFIIVKTVDDSSKSSYPDPDCIMLRTFELYEHHVRPNVGHTLHTDRNLGSKCHALLVRAGFANVRVKTVSEDTCGKSLAARMALFDRMTYFRKDIPPSQPSGIQKHMDDLLATWREMFCDAGYYFASPTFIALGMKPHDPEADFAYAGPLFGESEVMPDAPKPAGLKRRRSIVPLAESRLGEIMAIECVSFPDPWAPIAFAMELRHNPRASYAVALDGTGMVSGYVGVWIAGGSATIVKIAVDPTRRLQGAGTELVEWACARAASGNAKTVRLVVRSSNNGGRAFYKARGFEEAGVYANYYANPEDDGIVMTRRL